MRRSTTSEFHDWNARATEALEEAYKLAPGEARNEALKNARMLRQAADMKTFLAPPKSDRLDKT